MAGFFDRGCERAQAWASLELDGELSQLERALLAAHLRRCAGCASVVGAVRATTAALRAAPLEKPRRPLVPVPARPERRRARVALRVALATTLAALAAGLGVLAGSVGGGGGPGVPAPDSDIALRPPAARPSVDRLDEARDEEPGARAPREELPEPDPRRFGGV